MRNTTPLVILSSGEGLPLQAPPQHTVHESERGRIICMDSMGYVDNRCDVRDVLICGSHSAACATMLAARARPRAVIGHDAGIGLRGGGVSGLPWLARLRIPAAAVAASSARIADGMDMYERGVISTTNSWARKMGVKPGMSCQEAALLLLNAPFPLPPIKPVQTLVYESAHGTVLAMDTVKFADQRLAGGVLCMGSHGAPSMAKYVLALPFRVRGVITNSAGVGRDNAGINGLPVLDEAGIPCALVTIETAAMGDAVSTFRDGVIRYLNESARKIGIREGMTARDAGRLMLGEQLS